MVLGKAAEPGPPGNAGAQCCSAGGGCVDRASEDAEEQALVLCEHRPVCHFIGNGRDGKIHYTCLLRAK